MAPGNSSAQSVISRHFMLFLLVVLQDIEPKLLEATSIRDTRDLTLHWSLLIIIQTKRFHPIGCLTYVSHHPSHEELCWLQVSYNIYILYVYIYTHVVERERHAICHYMQFRLRT